MKGEDGRCVTREVRDKQRQARKEKKKKKKKKRMEAEARGNEGEELVGGADDDGVEIRRVHYPWYYILGPLSGSYVVCKYWRPNMVTSVGIILFISISATLSNY